jgi:hypothetical protein
MRDILANAYEQCTTGLARRKMYRLAGAVYQGRYDEGDLCVRLTRIASEEPLHSKLVAPGR